MGPINKSACARTDLADCTDGDVEAHPVLDGRASARRQQVIGRAVGPMRQQLEGERAGTGLRQQQTVVDVRQRPTTELGLQTQSRFAPV